MTDKSPPEEKISYSTKEFRRSYIEFAAVKLDMPASIFNPNDLLKNRIFLVRKRSMFCEVMRWNSVSATAALMYGAFCANVENDPAVITMINTPEKKTRFMNTPRKEIWLQSKINFYECNPQDTTVIEFYIIYPLKVAKNQIYLKQIERKMRLAGFSDSWESSTFTYEIYLHLTVY
jgi:hypothetical protein